MSNKPANSPAPTPAPSAAPAAPTDLQTAQAVADANGTAPAPAEAKTYPEVAYVRSKVGDMVHLFTGETLSSREVKIAIDGFARAQLDAGKWEIVN